MHLQILKNRFEQLQGCCLRYENTDFNPIRIIAHGESTIDYYGHKAIFIFENNDGRFGILEEDEDYSGHG